MRFYQNLFRSHSFHAICILISILIYIHFVFPDQIDFILSLPNTFIFILRSSSIICLYYVYEKALLPHYLGLNRAKMYYGGAVFLNIFFTALTWLATVLILKLFSHPIQIEHLTLERTIFHPMLSLFFYLLVFWISHAIYNFKRKTETWDILANQEVHFLRNQINPHFVFNSLNNIYSLALSKSDKTAESILKLSEILRYVFYETEKERIPLESEVKYLQNYVSFQAYRLPVGCKVHFNKSGDFEFADIVPMILINYVENAFKYGVSTFTNTQIDINVYYEKPWLTLTIENSIFAVAGHKSSKIGGENTLKRLEFHYPNSFSHEGKEREGKYYTKLKIKLI